MIPLGPEGSASRRCWLEGSFEAKEAALMRRNEIPREIKKDEWNIEYTRQNFLSNLIYYVRKIPPLYEGTQLWFNREQASPLEMSLVAYDYISELLNNDSTKSFWQIEEGEKNETPLNERPSAYLYEVMEFFLGLKMDPNFRTGTESLMHHLCRVVNGYLAADTLRFLLENGGDPNVLSGKRTLFDTVDSFVHQKLDTFDLTYVEGPEFQSVVHCWFVLLGFGGHSSEKDTPPLTRINKDGEELFRIEKLKNHRNYALNLGKSFEVGNSNCCRIYDIRTVKEVAWI